MITVDKSVYLWCKVMLLQLPSFSKIPGADCVIEASGPQLSAIIGDVNTAGSICVALELPGTPQDTKQSQEQRTKPSQL